MRLTTLMGRRKVRKSPGRKVRKSPARKRRTTRKATKKNIIILNGNPKRRRLSSHRRIVRPLKRRSSRRAVSVLGGTRGKITVKKISAFLKPVAVGVGGVLVGNALVTKIGSAAIPQTSKYTREYTLAAKLALALAIPRLWKKKSSQYAAFGLATVGVLEYVTSKWGSQLRNAGILSGVRPAYSMGGDVRLNGDVRLGSMPSGVSYSAPYMPQDVSAEQGL